MARTVRRFRSLTAALSAVLLVPAVGTTDIKAADWSPKAPPAIYDPNAGPNAERRTDYITDVCTTDEQLDCVESIAAQVNGAWVAGNPTTTLSGNSRLWEIPGIVNLNGTTRVAVNHRHNYTGNLFLTTTISAAPANGQSGDREDQSLPRDVPFRATIRTSWVLPTHIATKGTDVSTSVEKLTTSGASRVSLTSIPTTYMVVNDQSTLTDPNGKGALDIRGFTMTVSDGRFYPIKKDCIEKQSIMTGENGYGFSLPTFAGGNLDLRVPSPHFRSDGTTVHIGVYEAFIPLDTAKCLWGNSITSTSTFEVEVIESSGGAKTATKSVDVNEDGVSIKASGFTFSTPTIRVRSLTSTAKPAKPTGIRASAGKGTATVSFTRVAGLSYSAVATKGSSTKTVKCSVGKTRVTCKGTRLAKGRWKITVTPANGTVKGTTYSTTLSVK